MEKKEAVKVKNTLEQIGEISTAVDNFLKEESSRRNFNKGLFSISLLMCAVNHAKTFLCFVPPKHFESAKDVQLLGFDYGKKIIEEFKPDLVKLALQKVKKIKKGKKK